MTYSDLSFPNAVARAGASADYEICFLDKRGRLIATETATCAHDTQARILAHALRPDGTGRIEVWRGTHLVYERPHTLRSASFEVLGCRDVLAAQ